MTAKPTQTQTRWKSVALVSFATLCAAQLVAQGQDYEYTTTNGVVKITRYIGPGGDVTIPSTIDGLPVTTIGNRAFTDCTKVTSITIPDNVQAIESVWPFSWGRQGAFRWCANLRTATIGNGMTSIGGFAFADCASLATISIGASVENIEGSAFSGSTSLQDISVVPLNLTYSSLEGVLFNKDQTMLIQYPAGRLDPSYTIPESVTNVCNYAFNECARLTAVAIGARVTIIAPFSFDGCAGLQEITVAPLNVTYSSLDGVLFNKEQTTLIRYPHDRLEPSYTIPQSVTTIGGDAFRACTHLADVTLGDGVTDIGDRAFGQCRNLNNVVLGERVTRIRRSAFFSCDSLARIRIPDSVTCLERGTFSDCTELTDVSIGKGVIEIGDDAFSGCSKLTQIVIPDNVLSLGGAFPGCRGLTHVVIGNGVTVITGSFNEGCAGIGCPPTTHGTFSDCTSLTTITIGRSVTNIQRSAFVRCENLSFLSIPQGVSIIEYDAFAACPRLTGIFFEGHAPAVIQRGGSFQENSVFAYSPNVVVYYLPGRTGWEPTFSERRTALWNPRFQTSNPAFGLHLSGFGLPINGTADIPIVLEATTDPINQTWVPLLSCTLTNGSLELRDPEWAVYPKRFYRIRSP